MKQVSMRPISRTFLYALAGMSLDAGSSSVYGKL